METFYIVVLEALGNPDHGENPYQYITKPTQITSKTIDEIVDKAMKWQMENDIGAGNWRTPEVWRGNEIVGYMSYNGRIWAERR